jgi:hypothetical protein
MPDTFENLHRISFAFQVSGVPRTRRVCPDSSAQEVRGRPVNGINADQNFASNSSRTKMLGISSPWWFSEDTIP